MKIVIIGESLASYIAKCHEAFRTGLAGMYDVRFFGEGYDGFDPSIKTYPDIIKYTCPDGDPDLVIMRHYFPSKDRAYLPYEGANEVKIKKAFIQSDYWDMIPIVDDFFRFIQSNGIDYLFSYYPQPITLWQNTALTEKMMFVPCCFDPKIFTDWKEPKVHDVGFLAAGTVTPAPHFYPERHEYHNRLLQMPGIRYFYAAHPGWGEFPSDAPLVGKGFSRAMNACKIFVTTGGIYKNAQPKVFEALASRTMLLSDDAVAYDELGLVDGVNYVKIQPENLEEQVRYLLANPDLIESITEKGYQLALTQHSCYARAAQLRSQLYYRFLLEGLKI